MFYYDYLEDCNWIGICNYYSKLMSESSNFLIKYIYKKMGFFLLDENIFYNVLCWDRYEKLV